MPYRVTFVCTGNICRSPMAESVFRHHVEEEGLDVEVDSSGTGGWHARRRRRLPHGRGAEPRRLTGRRTSRGSSRTAGSPTTTWSSRWTRGIGGRCARWPRTRGRARRCGCCASSTRPCGVDLDVPDPYYGGRSDFDHALELVEAAMPGLLGEVRAAVKDG